MYSKAVQFVQNFSRATIDTYLNRYAVNVVAIEGAIRYGVSMVSPPHMRVLIYRCGHPKGQVPSLPAPYQNFLDRIFE